jgi:phosphonopyruvate decarboxylase
VSEYLGPISRGEGSGAILVSRGVFESEELPQKRDAKHLDRLTRERVIAAVLEHVSRDDMVIAGIGHTSRQLYATRIEAGAERSDRLADFYCVGGMGYALEVAIGIISAQPSKSVWVLEGDGSFLMQMGSAAGISAYTTSRITYILLDNKAHASVGGQPVASDSVDYCGVAKALGFSSADRVDTIESLARTLREPALGTRFIWVPILNEPFLKLPRPSEPLKSRKQAVMDRLGAGHNS